MLSVVTETSSSRSRTSALLRLIIVSYRPDDYCCWGVCCDAAEIGFRDDTTPHG
jgi:hypothetical protein